MKYFPINLNIENKLCTVIGGGKVAERKIFDILPLGPKVRVISKEFSKKILEIDFLEIIKDSYKPEYLDGTFLLFICTDNKQLNLDIFHYAKDRGILVNIATHPELCDFSVPSVIRRGDLQITVSTNGKSPALSKMIRKELEAYFGEEYAILLKIMNKIRERQLNLSSDSNKNRELFYKFLNSNVLKFLKNKDYNKVNDLIKNIFNFEVDF